MENPKPNRLIFFLVCTAIAIPLYLIYSYSQFLLNGGITLEIPYSELANEIDVGNIMSIEIGQEDGSVKGIFNNAVRGNLNFKSQGFRPDTVLIQEIRKKNPSATIKMKAEDKPNPYVTFFLYVGLPILVFVGFYIFMIKNMGGGGSKAFSFIKSKAKRAHNVKTNFKDVAGVEEAKEELREIIEFLKTPQKFQKLGGRIPKGVLLMGSPGTGKTLLARAVAGEANVPFFSISGSDFVEMFVGVGAARIRDLFEQGRKNAPCIIFIDEIDAVGRHRGTGLGGGHDEREQTLNQLLVELEGFESSVGVILIAATNRPDVLDPALLRPGRFDRRVVVDKPDVKGRADILRIHLKKIPLDLSSGTDIVDVIARGTAGFTGADLQSLANEAALNAARQNHTKVTVTDLEFAKDKVMMGSERRSMILSPEEKEITAYHEAGHAILAVLMPSADPLHKVTIIPRGMALGLTSQLPEKDRHNYSKEFLTSYLAILMAGRCAEEIKFGENKITSGASNDIKRATELAHSMVCEWGMSHLGPRAFGNKEEKPFLGRQMTEHNRDYSDKTAQDIDTKISELIDTARKTAHKILIERRNYLDAIAKKLIDREEIDGNDVKEILNRKGS